MGKAPAPSTLRYTEVTPGEAARFRELDDQTRELTDRLSRVLAERGALAQRLLERYGQRRYFTIDNIDWQIVSRRGVHWFTERQRPRKGKGSTKRIKFRNERGTYDTLTIAVQEPRPFRPAPRAIMVTPSDLEQRALHELDQAAAAPERADVPSDGGTSSS